MSFDLESDLEDAGIDAFDFSLMDEDERREALEDTGLDTDTYLDADLDSDFDAWSDLQSSGMSIQELKWMDDDERREALVNSGLDPDNYNGLLYDEGSHYSTHRATDEPTSSTAGTYVKSCESNDKPTNTEADFSAPPRETPHLPLRDQSAEKADYPDNNCNIIEKTPPWVKIMTAICILAFSSALVYILIRKHSKDWNWKRRLQRRKFDRQRKHTSLANNCMLRNNTARQWMPSVLPKKRVLSTRTHFTKYAMLLFFMKPTTSVQQYTKSSL